MNHAAPMQIGGKRHIARCSETIRSLARVVAQPEGFGKHNHARAHPLLGFVPGKVAQEVGCAVAIGELLSLHELSS
jgi:hypothetical protein